MSSPSRSGSLLPDLPELPEPVTEAGVAGLRSLVATPRAALIGLDFDGTLAPIVDEPAHARPHAGVSDTLRGLADRFGTVAIVTGRPAHVVAELLGFVAAQPPANLRVVGHYGLETWTTSAGVVRLAGVDLSWLDDVRRALPEVLKAVHAPKGTAIEDKGASVAVHVRQTSDPDAAMQLIGPPLLALATAHGARLEPGRLVLELRTAGVDKGSALDVLVRAADARAVCYVGDDLGDLAAFDTIDRLRAAGLAALAVCSGSVEAPEVPELAARADLVVDGPHAVADFLIALAGIKKTAAGSFPAR